MKKIITASLVATLALTSAHAASNAQLSAQLNELETQMAKVKKDLKKQNKKINKVKAHDSGDNIKWGVDLRTAYDNINYEMATGPDRENDSLYSLRLWLNMAYAPDEHNVFKGQLSMNKAFGASFDNPMNRPYDAFDWTTNESLTDNTLKVRQAYWLYLGDEAFGADMPWTFSLGRRPSTGGFLANLSQDDAAQSPLGHLINVEFDGLSSKLDLSKVTGVPGMSIKLCLGYGSTNAVPLIGSATPNSDDEVNGMDDIKLGGFIFEPYNDGQFIVKSTYYKAWDLPELVNPAASPVNPDGTLDLSYGQMIQVGDMTGAGLSVLVDGLTEDGYFADVKAFASYAWSQTDPDNGQTMLGSAGKEDGNSYWLGAYLPVTVADENYGTVGLEFNHGDQYWRPFTYAEDTMVGSKIAARGDAWEANYTYQLTDALSMQLRYVHIDYEYTGSNGFFGSTTGTSMKISDLQTFAAGSAAFLANGGDGAFDPNAPTANELQAMQTIGFAQNTVDVAEDFRFYLRYRF